MHRLVVSALVAALAVPLGACENLDAGPKQQTGAVLGGVLGGIGGAQVGKGGSSKRTAAIIGGTLLGALIGSQVGKSIDTTDELRAQQVLEYNRTQQPTSWYNPDTGANVTMVPVNTYQAPSGQYCREYQMDIVVGGRTEQGYGKACRQPDGSWAIVQ